MFFSRLKRAVGRLKISSQGAAQFALFAMLIQAMLPLTSAVPVNAGELDRNGQTIPNYFLVICTAYGAQTQTSLDGEPLDKVPTANAPWDCPICLMQVTAQGPAPSTPQVAFIPSLPRMIAEPVVSELRPDLWSAAPGFARGPPLV